MSDYPCCIDCGRENVTTLTIESENCKPTPPICTDCFSKRTSAAIRGMKGNRMGKTTTAARPRSRTTTRNGLKVDRTTGEVLNQTKLPVDQDLKKLERKIANAYVDLARLKDTKDEATANHKEGQDRLNALVGELTRLVNGEQMFGRIECGVLLKR